MFSIAAAVESLIESDEVWTPLKGTEVKTVVM